MADVGRGTYRLDDGPELEVTVHSLWDDAEAAAVPVLYSAARERGFESLHAVTYATGRSEVRYREGEGAESESAVSAESGVLHSVRQLIR